MALFAATLSEKTVVKFEDSKRLFHHHHHHALPHLPTLPSQVLYRKTWWWDG